MTIEPDTKDWTWVIERLCPECGYDGTVVRREDIAPAITANAESWHEVLRGRVGERPNRATWSPLEYACHVRDVLRLYETRLTLMLDADDPLYPNWDQDATAVDERYGEQDPAAVDGELQTAAGVIAGHFASLAAAQWERTGRRSDGASFTVDTFARYFLHDVVHHLHDVRG